MNYIVYNINNVDKDWIKNFNTKISATDYTLVVVGSSFDINLKPAAGGDYNSCNIYAFEQGDTWRISADYHDGTTYNGANGSWKVYCLAINKSIIKTIPPITVNMNRQPDRSAPNPPAGL
ncbi:hypothetical protein [Flavobacterium sp.]|uniref:hypothetical protein n=1 Tax=Flavobacterium sp. TaxID=239 RepID=UPI00261071D0|nr:hypothetical protein [Flavobacterium sp.]